ncbi:MAG: PAS domain-containing sensor histidine kinase [Rhodospirillaceae bacterium]|nr:PAS domain-containing sensor histidine kinase [Rhodospirillaceae bacterium]
MDGLGQAMEPSFWDRINGWASRRRIANKLAILLIIAGALAGAATYTALSENPLFGHDPGTIYLLLNLDLVILLLFLALIARRITALWVRRRRGMAGSRLHVRLVALFSLLAVAPAIFVAAFSVLFFHLGLQSWFSERVSTAVNESLSVAQAYLAEHQQLLRADALAMASDLNREAPRLVGDPNFFNQFVTTQAVLRNLTEAMVMDGAGRMLARSVMTFSLQFEVVPEERLQEARLGDVILLPSENDDRVRALIHLDNFVDTYLLVGRLIEPRVIAHMDIAEGAVADYRALEARQSSLQITFSLIYVVVALLLLMVAIWIGLMLADGIVTPVGHLIAAADRVRSGDLSARVTGPSSDDELGNLSRAFNRMTSQLESQRQELVDANEQLDHRRRFTEAVLAGVSAGVLGLDSEGRIDLPNRSATVLLGTPAEQLEGMPLGEAVPEMAPLIEQIRARPGRMVDAELAVQRQGETRTLLVRIVAEQVQGQVGGYVVTFDDITELMAAQRKAAWADVARRIAHEIKNPLTPIQLSAERLKRRYLKEIKSDPAVFVTCTDTIVRHVADIGRMVSEFSSFARMPTPVMRAESLVELVRQSLQLQQSAHPDIHFTLDLPEEPLPPVSCDAGQVTQVLTNVLQNAIDAIEGRREQEGGNGAAGAIGITASFDERRLALVVDDNGCGLPQKDRDRLTDPYVTTRAKGTGLGLAIVKKIMEDHGGRLILQDRPEGGARVVLTFPLEDTAAGAPMAGRDSPGAERRQA